MSLHVIEELLLQLQSLVLSVRAAFLAIGFSRQPCCFPQSGEVASCSLGL